MITHITAFIVYTLAMIGVLVVGYVIYKKTNFAMNFENRSMIKILDSVAIGPKKNLLIVKIKNQEFLIASGQEHTTFLAKLDTSVQLFQGKNDDEIHYRDNNMEITEKIKEKFQIAKNQKELEQEVEMKKQNKLQQLQQQFMDLYYKDIKEKTQKQEEPSSQFIRTIMKELESRNLHSGANING